MPQHHHHLVQLETNQPLEPLFKIKTLAYQKIHWEKMKKAKIFQCRNCQRIGHDSINCNLPRRCVKCSLTHDIGKCTIVDKDNKMLLTCAYCKQNGNPASYKGCPYSVHTNNLIKNQEKIRKGNTQTAIKTANEYITESKSYASTISNKTTNNQNSQQHND